MALLPKNWIGEPMEWNKEPNICIFSISEIKKYKETILSQRQNIYYSITGFGKFLSKLTFTQKAVDELLSANVNYGNIILTGPF